MGRRGNESTGSAGRRVHAGAGRFPGRGGRQSFVHRSQSPEAWSELDPQVVFVSLGRRGAERSTVAFPVTVLSRSEMRRAARMPSPALPVTVARVRLTVVA